MGFVESVGRFLRTGVAAPTLDARALQKYSSFESMSPSWSPINVETFVREAHRKNALAFACIEYVARAAATPILEAVREKGDGFEELPPLDPLRRLMERPSEDYPSQTRFVRQVVRLLLATGECILYKVPGARSGMTVDLQMLPPGKVAVERKTDGTKTYLYHYDPAMPPKRLKEEGVIFLKFDDLVDPDRGLSPLQAAARETDVDNATADIRKTFFEHGAMLDMYLKTEQQATPEQLKEWSALWTKRYGGPKNAHKTPALAGGLDVGTVGATPDKWAFKEVTGLTEARICSAFGVPPILVGAKIGLDRSTYANYEAARSAFWEDTATPLLVFLADEFTGGLTDLSDGRRCRWNTDEVPALQEDADAREERAGRGLERGAILVDEYRAAAGLDPLPGGEGRVYMVPSGYTIVKEGDLAPAEEEEESDGGTVGSEGGEGAGEEGEEGEGQQPPAEDAPPEETQRGLVGVSEERGAEDTIPLRDPQAPLERRESAAVGRLRRLLARAIEGVLGRQADAVAESVTASPEGSVPDADVLFDVAMEAQRMAEAVLGHIRGLFAQAGEEAAGEADGSFDPDGEAFPEEAADALGRAMAETTRDTIQAGVDEGRGSGWTNDEIAERLREIVADRDRANLTAETETVRTANRAARSAYEQNDVRRIVWRTTSEEVCEFCRQLDGTEVGIDDAFAELDDQLEGADGGTTTVTYERLLGPPLHPRCGCFLEPQR